jgi:hypothetical protein
MYAFYCFGVEPRLYGPFETVKEAEAQLRAVHMPPLGTDDEEEVYCDNGCSFEDHGIEKLRSPRDAKA